MTWSGPDRRGAKRTLLGSVSGFSLRQRVYRTREALEVDEIEGYDVTRRRVFYDDVLLVTYHQFVGVAFVVITTLATAAFAAIAIALGLSDLRGGLILFAVTALPFLLALILRLALRVDAVTVYGRRTKAQVHFWLRKRKARTVFAQVCRAVAERQEKLARELDALRAGRPIS